MGKAHELDLIFLYDMHKKRFLIIVDTVIL